MTLYAIDDVGDAVGATKRLLWPFDPGRWAKLAVVVLFVGGAGGVNPLQFGGSTPTGDGPGGPGGGPAPGPGAGTGLPDGLPSIGTPELAVVGAVVAVLVLLGLAVALVGSIMEFVLVESLRNEAVTIRRYWGRHWGAGLRLFGFRLALGLLALGAVGLPLVAVLSPALFGNGEVSLGALVVALPVVLVVALLAGLVDGFTTAFVVPIMLLEDRGPLSGWRRLWPTVAGQWKQYLVYVVAGAVLGVVGGIAASIVVALAAFLIAIPLGIVGLLGVGLLGVAATAGWAVIGLVVVLFVLAVILAFLFASVPVTVFLRYYALFVLGDTNDAFDAVPEQRRAVRE